MSKSSCPLSFLELCILYHLSIISLFFNEFSVSSEGKFLILTVATEETSGFKRYQRSVKVNGLPLKVLGMGEKWEGGDMANSVGGGQKVLMLRKELELHKNDPEKIIMFT